MLLVLLFGAQVLFAQKIVTVHGEDTYYAPSNISLDEAKHTVLERAKLKALEAEFGTLVSQSTSTVSQSNNGQTDFRMLTMGGSQVKGEWVETVGEPEYDIKFEQGMFVVSVKVTGKARELKKNNIDLQVKVLKNSTDLREESDQFTDGDTFYMYFRSPISGYLTIYMEDEANQMVSCLLPYLASNEGSVKVEANQDYIFFAPKDSYDRITDQYILYSSHSVDYETIFVVFSPNQFYKANAQMSQTPDVPLQLSHDEFMSWLMRNDTNDKDMNVVRKNILIKRKAANTIK